MQVANLCTLSIKIIKMKLKSSSPQTLKQDKRSFIRSFFLLFLHWLLNLRKRFITKTPCAWHLIIGSTTLNEHTEIYSENSIPPKKWLRQCTHFSGRDPVSEPARIRAEHWVSPWPLLSGGWVDCGHWRVAGGSLTGPPPERTGWPCIGLSQCMDSLLVPLSHLHPKKSPSNNDSHPTILHLSFI